MEERVSWNEALVNLIIEAERNLLAMRGALIPTDSKTKLHVALACLDQMKIVLARMPKIISEEHLDAGTLDALANLVRRYPCEASELAAAFDDAVRVATTVGPAEAVAS